MDRRTTFGKRPAKGDNIKEDIQFDKMEPSCGRKQAQIEHRYNGYYLVEREPNGYTRIMIKPDTPLQLYPGCTISFGANDTMTVLEFVEEEEAKVEERKQIVQTAHQET